VARKGSDTRHVVTNIKSGTARYLYETAYCARGQAENLIKRQKRAIWHPAGPVAAGQPDTSDFAHCRLLVDAEDPAGHPKGEPSATAAFSPRESGKLCA
jgi:hypothetical protein